MPTFPTYPGALPSCLNPLNLRHYFLLAYWVFFRPTALKCYLYQADPDLYRAGPGFKIFRTLYIQSYRNLYLVTIGLVSTTLTLLYIPALLSSIHLTGLIQPLAIYLVLIIFGVVIGITAGTLLGIFGGVASGVLSGIIIVGGLAITFAVPEIAIALAGGNRPRNLMKV